jgi:hypothetical protein
VSEAEKPVPLLEHGAVPPPTIATETARAKTRVNDAVLFTSTSGAP